MEALLIMQLKSQAPNQGRKKMKNKRILKQIKTHRKHIPYSA